MRLLRSTFFWLHLAAGLVCGLVIFIMSFTGAVLAFEHEIVEWAERDLRRVEPPAINATALPLDELIAKAREAATAPEAESAPRVAGVTVSSDPRDAVAVNFGRDLGTYYVDQYTGEVRAPTTTRTHDFMHLMEDWHRRLAATGDKRDTGRAITGASNAAFLFLALSGLWLWWPRKWRLSSLKPSLWFTGAKGKARDWNWHNVYGFWFLPVLIVLTASGMVISYRWASDLAYRVVGETPPAVQGPGAAAPAQEFKIERPEGARRLGFAQALERIQSSTPGWTQITLREGLPQRRGARPAGATAPGQGPASATGQNAQANSPASGEGARSGPRDGSGRGAGRAPQPYSATVKADDGSPVFASTQLVLNPFTGETLSRNGYADQSTGRKVRSWLRYLHTGQAFGWIGQLVAGLACVGGCILVYTGFALSFRRFFKRRAAKPASA
jgi:Uncharacterized iron-regulated membrane protein